MQLTLWLRSKALVQLAGGVLVDIQLSVAARITTDSFREGGPPSACVLLHRAACHCEALSERVISILRQRRTTRHYTVPRKGLIRNHYNPSLYGCAGGVLLQRCQGQKNTLKFIEKHFVLSDVTRLSHLKIFNNSNDSDP